MPRVVPPCHCARSAATIDFLPAQIDPRDPSGVGEVVERVGIEHDEARALAGCDRTHVGEAEDLGRRARGGDEHLLRRHPRFGHPLQLLQRRVAGVAVLNAAVVSEGDGHAGSVQFCQAANLHLVRARLVRIRRVSSPFPQSRSACLVGRASAIAAGENTSARIRVVEPGPLTGGDPATVDAEVRRDVHVLLLHPRDERVVHFRVANRMQEAVDARFHEIARVGQIEHVRHHANPVPVRFVDDRAVQRRRELLHGAASVVDPDLDEIRLLRGDLPDVLPRALFARDAVWRVSHRRSSGTGIGHGEPASRRAQERGAGHGLSTKLIADVARIGAGGHHRADAVVRVLFQLVDDGFACCSWPSRTRRPSGIQRDRAR